MKVRILEPAEQDLVDGYHFYESQAEGVGQYFLDCRQNPEAIEERLDKGANQPE